MDGCEEEAKSKIDRTSLQHLSMAASLVSLLVFPWLRGRMGRMRRREEARRNTFCWGGNRRWGKRSEWDGHYIMAGIFLTNDFGDDLPASCIGRGLPSPPSPWWV